jgi:hypothetical protein
LCRPVGLAHGLDRAELWPLATSSLDSGLVQQIRCPRTFRMRASGLTFIRVGLTQQQVDFDRPKVCAIVRMAIRVRASCARPFTFIVFIA